MYKFMLSMSTLLFESTRLTETAKKVNEILHIYVEPILSVLGSLGILYIIILGVQYAKSESADKRAECKKRITNLAIGVVILLVLLVICFAIQWDKIVPQLFGYYPGVND